MNNQDINKLSKLRETMASKKIDAYIVPRADEYLGEFVAPYAERLAWLTNFTGSAGMAVIFEQSAVVMSDGRYITQLEQQLDASIYSHEDTTKYLPHDWLFDHVQEGQVIGFDPHLHSVTEIEALEKRLAVKNVELRALNENLIDQVWDDQPEKPRGEVVPFPEEFAGRSYKDKMAAICDSLAGNDIDFAVLTQPDSICWLLNVRGTDLKYTPVALSYVVVDVQNQSIQNWDDAIDISQFKHKRVALDYPYTPYVFKQILEGAEATLVDNKDPCVILKACKTQAEQKAIEAAHVLDGIALVKFLKWFEDNGVGKSEMSVADKLEDFRRENPAYKSLSFPTISGFGPNGAVIHYRASKATNLEIGTNNLLLLDSGGQYLGEDCAGTTDITRTISTGDVPDDVKKQFTLVLKGHVVLSRAKFPYGTTGAQLDAVARGPLWNEGLDYNHGTGHGVGCYLAVHEEASNISPRGKDAVEEGMLLSNEPGYYEVGSHGIRTENLVLAQKCGVCEATGKDMLCFKTVTLAPYDMSIVDKTLLTADEMAWINDYHQQVFDKLSPHLDEGLQLWLKGKCSAI